MKKSPLLAVGLLAIGFSVSASAADLPARTYSKTAAMVTPAAYDWSGFYIGVNGGGAWSKTDQFDPVDATGAAFPGARQNGSGGFAGGTAGYNYQINHIVLGVEGDADWANIHSQVMSAACGVGVTCSVNDSFLGTIRERVGYAANNWLFYATGGAVFSQFRYRTFATATGVDFGMPFKTSPVGWVGGAGIEYGLTPNWSIKGEYSYYGFGAQQAPSGVLTAGPVNTHTDIQVVKFGANYRFNWGGPVVANY
jgi:outer membrane immunogenic protein